MCESDPNNRYPPFKSITQRSLGPQFNLLVRRTLAPSTTSITKFGGFPAPVPHKTQILDSGFAPPNSLPFSGPSARHTSHQRFNLLTRISPRAPQKNSNSYISKTPRDPDPKTYPARSTSYFRSIARSLHARPNTLPNLIPRLLIKIWVPFTFACFKHSRVLRPIDKTEVRRNFIRPC